MTGPRLVYAPGDNYGAGSAVKYFQLLQGEYGGKQFDLKGQSLTAAFKAGNYDLAIVRGDWHKTYQAALATNTPYVLIEHDVHSLRRKLTISDLRCEKEMVENAQAIIFTSEDHAAYLGSKYRMPEHRVVHLRPLASDIDFEPRTEKLKGRHVVYAGGTQAWSRRIGPYGYRAYHRIFKRFIDSGWRVHLYPAADDPKKTVEYERMGCIIHKKLSYPELLREMGQYTAGLQAYNRIDVPARAFAYTQACCPNKTWDYLAAGIPTIGINAGNTARIYEAGGWGVWVRDPSRENLRALSLPMVSPDIRAREVMDNDLPILREVIDIALQSTRRAVACAR